MVAHEQEEQFERMTEGEQKRGRVVVVTHEREEQFERLTEGDQKREGERD